MPEARENRTAQHNHEQEVKHLRRRIAELERLEREHAWTTRQLHRSRELYRAILENVKVGIALLSPQMEVLEMNRAMRDWFPHIDADERPICYRVYNDPPREEPCPYCPTIKTLEDGRVHESVTETPGRDGVRNFRIVASAIRDAEGEVVAAIELVDDITELQRNELALEKALAQQRALFENIPAAVFLKDAKRRYVATNRAYHQMLPPDIEDPSGMRDEDIFPSRLADAFAAEDTRVLRTGETLRKEEPIRLRDGSVVQMAVSLAPVRSAGGEVTGIVGIAFDITERRRAERALAESERRFRTVFEEAPIGKQLYDADGQLEAANPACLDIFGIRAVDEVTGFTLFDDPTVPGAAKDSIRRGKPVRYERELVVVGRKAKGQEVKSLDVQINPLPEGEDGRPAGYVLHIQDITARRRAELQMQRTARKLQRLNAELQRSNRELQEFTYSVSHDLQEPLRKIHSFGEFLMEDCADELPEVGHEHVRRMQDAARRMKELIQHLLALARVGTRGGNMVEVDTSDAVEEVLDTLSERIAETDAEIELEDGLPTVVADPVQLRQVFQNLLSNALKFRHPERKPCIRIRREKVEEGMVTLCVDDNGIGIQEEFLDRIFMVFQKLHPRGEYDGSGVGLSLCAKIIRRHGGEIWAESEPGVGTCMKLTLPLSKRG